MRLTRGACGHYVRADTRPAGIGDDGKPIVLCADCQRKAKPTWITKKLRGE